jgi:hypothetical protein
MIIALFADYQNNWQNQAPFFTYPHNQQGLASV